MNSSLWILILLTTVVVRHGGMMTGGRKEIPLDEVDWKSVPMQAALNAFKNYDLKKAGINAEQEEFNPVKVQEQVVQGLKLYVTFESKEDTCTVQVWYRSWKDPSERIKVEGPECNHQSA